MSSRAERERLRPLAEAVLMEALDASAVARLCPRCGSSTHGRPLVRRGRRPRVWASLAYAPDLAVAAWCDRAPVGVDVERVGPGDPASPGLPDLVAWTRAEATAKATGRGLAQDPGVERVERDDVWLQPLALPDGYVGHLAVLGRESAEVRWRAVGPAAVPRAARG